MPCRPPAVHAKALREGLGGGTRSVVRRARRTVSSEETLQPQRISRRPKSSSKLLSEGQKETSGGTLLVVRPLIKPKAYFTVETPSCLRQVSAVLIGYWIDSLIALDGLAREHRPLCKQPRCRARAAATITSHI